MKKLTREQKSVIVEHQIRQCERRDERKRVKEEMAKNGLAECQKRK